MAHIQVLQSQKVSEAGRNSRGQHVRLQVQKLQALDLAKLGDNGAGESVPRQVQVLNGEAAEPLGDGARDLVALVVEANELLQERDPGGAQGGRLVGLELQDKQVRETADGVRHPADELIATNAKLSELDQVADVVRNLAVELAPIQVQIVQVREREDDWRDGSLKPELDIDECQRLQCGFDHAQWRSETGWSLGYEVLTVWSTRSTIRFDVDPRHFGRCITRNPLQNPQRTKLSRYQINASLD